MHPQKTRVHRSRGSGASCLDSHLGRQFHLAVRGTCYASVQLSHSFQVLRPLWLSRLDKCGAWSGKVLAVEQPYADRLSWRHHQRFPAVSYIRQMAGSNFHAILHNTHGGGLASTSKTWKSHPSSSNSACIPRNRGKAAVMMSFALSAVRMPLITGQHWAFIYFSFLFSIFVFPLD